MFKKDYHIELDPSVPPVIQTVTSQGAIREAHTAERYIRQART